MDHKLQKVFVTIFMGLLTGMAILLICMPKQQFSVSERRRLSLIPKLTADSIEDKTYMNSMEEYLLDHFPFREQFRRIKAYYAYGVLQQKENNDIYVAEGYAGKLEYPLQQSSVEKACARMMTLQEQYFPDAQTYYAIVPDKNYYLAKQNGFPAMDYNEMERIMQHKLPTMSYIPLWDTLELEDYYHTDTHWRQDRLHNVLERLGEYMDFSIDMTHMSVQEVMPFYGVYYGQSALPMQPDTLYYLTDETIEAASVWNLEKNRTDDIYQLNILNEENVVDKYDIFMGGAASVQVITSPKAQTGRKLIIFRDSFTSSLAPLLSEVYHETILIDTRYIASSLLGEYVDFSNADVLFLYNTILLNHASMLK